MALTSTNKFFNIAYGNQSTLGNVTKAAGNVYFAVQNDNHVYLQLDTPTDTINRVAVSAPWAAEAALASKAHSWVSAATLEAKGSGPITLTTNNTDINAGESLSLTAGLTAKGITEGYIGDGAVTTVKIADGAVTTAKITDGNVTNAKLQYNYITIGGQNVALGSSVALQQLRSDLGLSSALRYVGMTGTAMTDGQTTVPVGVYSGSASPQTGDVVIVEDTKKEFVYANGTWREFGDPSSFMTKLSAAYTKGATADGSNLTVVTGIKQAVSGAVTAYTGTLPNASTSAKGVAKFNATHFSDDKAGTISLNTSGSWSAPAANKLNSPVVVTISSSNGSNTVTHEENDFSTGKLDLKLPATITATLSGNASSATALTSKNIGSNILPVYFDGNGKPVAVATAGSGKRLNVDISGVAASADQATKWASDITLKIGNKENALNGNITGGVVTFNAADIGSTVVWQTWD